MVVNAGSYALLRDAEDVAAQKGNSLPLVHLEADAKKNLALAVMDVQAGHLDNWSRAHATIAP